MDGGFTGRLLHIDLGRGTYSVEEYPADIPEQLLGGFGSNNRLFREYCSKGTPPLSPDNPVIFGAGPFVGTPVPGSSRVMANSRLPMTGAVASASGSMGLGAQLKWAGFDHLVLTGRADEPTLVVITDSRVFFEPARDVWGEMVLPVTRRLWKAYPGSSVTTVGPAGENGVALSLAMIDAGATLGRGGLGAVLGSKNVKALVVRGTGGVRVADPSRLQRLLSGLRERLAGYPMREAALELGMIGAWPMFACKLLPAGAGEKDVAEAVRKFGPEAYLRLKRSRVSCPSCFLADKDELEIPGRAGTVFSTSFLNAAIMGAGFDMEDAAEAASTLALLDDLGLDFMTLSAMALFLLDMARDGLLDEGDVEGLPLERSGELLRLLADMVCFRKGTTGGVFAEGWAAVLDHFGEDAERFTMLVRNQDCLYDPRVTGLGTMEFEQIVSPRGPTSASSGSPTYLPDVPPDRIRRLTERMGAGTQALERIFALPGGLNVGRLTRYSEDWFSLFSSLGICNRHQINRFYHPELIRDLLEAVTGLDIEVGDMMDRCAFAFELYRELNAREGLGVESDVIPPVWLDERPVWGRGGRLKDYFGHEIGRREVEALLSDYYDERSRGHG